MIGRQMVQCALAMIVLLVGIQATAQEPGIITTVAGTGTQGYSGDGGPAVQAQISTNIDVAVDGAGSLYLNDYSNQRIRRIRPDGIIETIAGTGVAGFSGDGGLAVDAQLQEPMAVSIAPDGSIYISDRSNLRIRRIRLDGIIETVAGTGVAGFSGDGGLAIQADLNWAQGIAIDVDGSVYIADTQNQRIRRIRPDGIIETFAGTGVAGFSGDDGPAIQAQLRNPNDVFLDGNGNLYIADTNNNRIRRVRADGVIETVAGTGQDGFFGDGGPAILAGLKIAERIAVDHRGYLYISDHYSHRIRMVDPQGIITTVAGSGPVGGGFGGYAGDEEIATQARLSGPNSVAVDANGNLYLADRNNFRIRKVDMQWPVVIPAPDTTLTVFEDLPIIFIHGHGGGIDVEDTWKDLVSNFIDGYDGYTIAGDVYEKSAQRLVSDSLPSKSIFFFHYYRTDENAAWGDPSGQIGGLQKGHTSHNILVGWNPFYRIDYDHGRPSYAERLSIAVEHILRATGAPKVMLVGHSMGGLVARAYIKWFDREQSVYKLLTVGTPNGGFPEGHRRWGEQFVSGDNSWQWSGETEEMFNGGWFEGRSYTDWLNDDWAAFSSQNSVHYGTIRGIYDPVPLDGVGGDGVVEQNSAVLDGAVFNTALFACHNQDFFIVGRRPAILALEKSASTAHIIKRWLLDGLNITGSKVALEIGDIDENEGALTIHWDTGQGAAGIANYIATLDGNSQYLPNTSASITYENISAGNHIFALSARDENEDFLGTVIRHLIIDPTEEPQKAADLPLGEWVEQQSPGWMVFDLSSPGYLNLTLTIPNRSRDLDLFLYSSDDISKKLSSSATFSPIENIYRPLNSGTYYVEVREWGQPISAGNFFLRSEFVADPQAPGELLAAPIPLAPTLDGSHLSFDIPGSGQRLSVDIPEEPYLPASYDPELVAVFKTPDPLAALSDLIREYGPQPCVDIRGNTFRSFTDFFFYLSNSVQDAASGTPIPAVDLGKLSNSDAVMGSVIASEGGLSAGPGWVFFNDQNALRQLMNAEKEFALSHPTPGLFPNPAARGKLASAEAPYLMVSLESANDDTFLFFLGVVAPESIFSSDTIAERIAPALSISPLYRYVSSNSGNTFFHVENSGHGYLSWTALTETPWLKIETEPSGINSKTLNVRYETNSGSPRTGLIAIKASDGTQKVLEVRQANVRDYEIGRIPPGRVDQGDILVFMVHADEQGLDASLSMEISDADPPQGRVEFDPSTRLFTYQPDPQDRESFDVIFFPSAAEDAVSQTVKITPVSHEHEVLTGSLTHADPQSRDYITVDMVKSASPRTLNHLPDTTTTYDVSISGKTLVIERGHDNNLFDFDDRKNIARFSLSADTVIVRSPLRLPQTDVTIYANELRFEDKVPEEFASISTTPDNFRKVADSPNEGLPGLQAGDLTLYINSFHSDPGTDTRFILEGGKGQGGYLGRDGNSGNSLKTVTSIYDYSKTWHWIHFATDESTLKHVTRVEYYEMEWNGWQRKEGYNDNDNETWRPVNGEPATPGGMPGRGGNGGEFFSSIDLGQLANNEGGEAGESAGGYKGGAAGIPVPAYWVKLRNQYNWNRSEIVHREYEIIDTHTAVAGQDAISPSAATPGAAGNFTPIDNPFSWFHPHALKMTLAHARDTYRFGHLDDAASTLRTYVTTLDDFQEAEDYWNTIPAEWKLEFSQMQDEMRILLHRIDSNLDFYGHPVGWVPMLSFEVTQAAYENEINRAIRVFYLSYWLSHAEYGILQKQDALEENQTKLKEEIAFLQGQYETAVKAIPELKTESVAIKSQIEWLQIRLQEIEKRMWRQAKNKVEGDSWQQLLRTAGAICTVFPLGQPVLGSIGQGMKIIADYDPNNLWPTITNLGGLAGDFSEKAWGVAGENLAKELENLGTLGKLSNWKMITEDPGQYLNNLQTATSPFIKTFKSYQKELKNMQVPRDEVEAELVKLKASDAEFNQIVDEIAVLLVRKEKFARKLAETLQRTSDLPNRISNNLLAIDALKEDIALNKSDLSPRAVVYVKDMEHRARERLHKYQYYMAKAYEYRLLEPYSSNLNLSSLFDQIVTMVDSQNKEAILTGDDFDNLKVPYEEAIASVASDIFFAYDKGRPEHGISVEPSLSQDELRQLNSGLPVIINVMDRGMFSPGEEDVRITNLKVKGMKLNAEDLASVSSDNFGHLTVYAEHSGISKLRKDGKVFLFRHSTQNPSISGGRMQLKSGSLGSIGPSEASLSLLASLLPSKDIMPFSRPSAWADIILTKEVITESGADVAIDSLTLEVQYDYTDAPDNLSELRVLASDGLRPRFSLDTSDLNKRQDGTGTPVLYRMYPQEVDPITLTAPEEYGCWRFDKWIDRSGKDWGTDAANPAVELSMAQHQEIWAKYVLLPSRFSFEEETGDSYSILVQSASVESMPLETGDEIGVFTSDGLCVGALVWAERETALAAWKDNSQTPTIDGFHSNKQIFFKMWDQSEGMFRQLKSANYVEGDSLFGSSAAAVVQLEFAEPDTVAPEMPQIIPLPQGWSWISFNILPVDRAIPAVMSSCENLVVMQNNAGRAYWPTHHHNDIGELDISEGFKVYLSEPDTITTSGLPVASTTPIPLEKGWNFLSYLPMRPMDASMAFASAADNLVVALRDDGKAYFPRYGLNDMGYLYPGKGYKLYLAAADTLVYPSVAVGKSLAVHERQVAAPQYFADKIGTGDAHCILINSAEGLARGDEIAVVTQDDQLVGSVVWEGQAVSLPAWKDDERTPEKDGWQPGDRLRFQVWDRAADRVTEPEASYVEGTDSPGEMPVTVVRLSARSLPREYALSQNHPNPFNPSTTIRYALPENGKVTLSIYNMVGQKIQTLVDSWQQAGAYVAHWNGKDESGREVGSGIYLCRMESGAFTRVNKMVLLK